MALTRIYGNLISSATLTGNIFQAQSITGNSIAVSTLTGNLIVQGTITGDKIAAATIGSSNLTSTGVTAGIYGGSGNTVSLTVDTQGRITSAVNVSSNLTSTGVTAGIYGGSGNTVSLTVDTQGRITSAVNVAANAGSSQWTTSGSNIYYNTGQVGIGSTTAGQADRLYVYHDVQSSIPTAYIYKSSGGGGGSSIPEYGLDVYSGQMRNNTTAIYALRTRSDNGSGLEGTTQYALYAEVTPRNNGSHYGAYIKGGHGNVDGSGTQTVAVIEGAVYYGTGTSGTIYGLRLDGTSNYVNFRGLHIKTAYTGSSTQTFQLFTRNGSDIGSITTSTTATAYNTSSDYRLKENVQPLTGALAKVQQLKPCKYTWKKDGSSGEGFIAHELAEVIPQAVTGEKDEVRVESYEVTPAVYRDITIPAVFDDNGNETRPEQIEKEVVSPAVMGEHEVPSYQGIDTSFLVATLTAAIQEQQAMIASLKARLDAANL